MYQEDKSLSMDGPDPKFARYPAISTKQITPGKNSGHKHFLNDQKDGYVEQLNILNFIYCPSRLKGVDIT